MSLYDMDFSDDKDDDDDEDGDEKADEPLAKVPRLMSQDRHAEGRHLDWVIILSKLLDISKWVRDTLSGPLHVQTLCSGTGAPTIAMKETLPACTNHSERRKRKQRLNVCCLAAPNSKKKSTIRLQQLHFSD